MPEALLAVGAYSTWFEANLVKAELEAFDLSPWLADAQTINANWLWSNALGGIKVQILESEAAEARRILEAEADPGGELDWDDAAADACPVCGSSSTHPYVDKRGSFLTWLILGVPMFPALSRRVCADCGSKWKQ